MKTVKCCIMHFGTTMNKHLTWGGGVSRKPFTSAHSFGWFGLQSLGYMHSTEHHGCKSVWWGLTVPLYPGERRDQVGKFARDNRLLQNTL